MDIPSRGDKVYKAGLKQSNGYVVRVLRNDEEVVVKFHDTNEYITFSLCEFEGRYTHKFGGVWYLEN